MEIPISSIFCLNKLKLFEKESKKHIIINKSSFNIIPNPSIGIKQSVTIRKPRKKKKRWLVRIKNRLFKGDDICNEDYEAGISKFHFEEDLYN